MTCIVSSAAYSEDGIDWSTMNSPEGTFERAEIVDVIAYDDGFLAVGEILPAESENVTGAVWISVDRETWQLVEGSQMDTGPLYGVCEGIGYWRAEHKGAAAENRVLQVGTVIVDTDYDCRPLRDPTADTYLRSSTNPTEWQPEPVPAEIAQTDDYWNDSVRTLIGGRQFLIAANDRPAILRSSDGASWEVANLEGAPDARVTQLVELDDGYLALGWSSTAFSERTVWSSQDGAEWTVALKVAAEDDNPLVSMTSFGSGVVARGFFRFEPDKPSTLGVSVSFDGSRWSYPQSHPFEGQAFDQMASNGTSVLVATLDDDGAGDLLMWRADVSGLQP